MSQVTAQIKKYFEKIEALFGKSFYHDPVTISFLTIFGVLIAVLLLLIIFQVQPNVSQVPLTYNVLFGVTYASSWYAIYSYLLALLVLGGLNFTLAWAFFDKERLISYLIACVTLIIALLTILYVYNLTSLVK